MSVKGEHVGADADCLVVMRSLRLEILACPR